MEQNPDSILEEIRGIGHNAKTIYSDDKNAVERIKAKIELLKGAADPYGNKAAEIRRLKGRLLELAPEEFAEYQSNITVNGVKPMMKYLPCGIRGLLKNRVEPRRTPLLLLSRTGFLRRETALQRTAQF